MKIGKLSVLFLAAALVSGCKGFWDVPSGSGGGTGTASGVFYVLNQKTSQIAGYSFAKASTTLTAVTNSPTSLGASLPFTMAISPNGGFLYVSTASGIYVYSVGTDGSLTILNSSGVISADPAFTMEVDPSGSWLVEIVSGAAAVNAIPLDGTTGLLLSGSTEQSVALPSGATAVQKLTLTRSAAANPYVFVAMGSSGLAVIPFTAANTDPFGTVGTISPKNTTGGDTTVAVDVSRPLLYVGETVAVTGSNPGGLRVFNIGVNATPLTEVSGSPYATAGIGPSAILPTTNYVYVANKSVSGSTPGNITGFAITTTGSVYSLTSVSTVAAGTSTIGLAEESTGTYVLAVNASGSPDLNAYTFDTTTAGKLDLYASSATGTDPVQAVAIVAP